MVSMRHKRKEGVMTKVRLRRALLTAAAVSVVLVATQAAYATDPTPKWCEGVNIAAFAGGFSGGDWFAKAFVSGFHQAELDLGPSVYVYYSQWNPKAMLAQLGEAIDNKVDGVAFMGISGDAASDDLIDKAFAQGTVVTTLNVALPDAEKKHSSQGMGYVGPSNSASGAALANEAVKRAGLKVGDSVFVWGSQDAGGDAAQRTIGLIDAFEKAGAKVIYRDVAKLFVPDKDVVTPGAGSSLSPAPTFVDVMGANPGVKVVALAIHPGGMFSADALARAASLKPGQVFFAAYDMSHDALRAMKSGYLNLVLDDQPYLQGYLPILNICLTKKFGFSGLDVNTGGTFIDSSNVEAITPLVEDSIR
jgi:simple sugar transport system substrate-binding protein